jgi:hypothetical protein
LEHCIYRRIVSHGHAARKEWKDEAVKEKPSKLYWQDTFGLKSPTGCGPSFELL